MSNQPAIVALIPARSGSKRVKNKNIKQLADHPVIAYTIFQAVASSVFDAVIVSTEDETTADIARHYGAEVPFMRLAEYAADRSPDIEWLTYTLQRLESEGRTFDCFSILRPTSPFRQPETIRRAWQQFKDTPGIDSLRAVERVRQHPGKMWVIHGDRMTPLLLNPRGVPWHSSATQSLPPVYVQNASLEIAWTRVVLEEGTIAGEVLAPFITEGYEGYDINDPEDWWLAEELIRQGQVVLPYIDREPYPLDLDNDPHT
jgi:CMP-N,N'-diacetyllegionaminic acid synthase